MQLLGYETKTTYDDLKVRWLWVRGPRLIDWLAKQLTDLSTYFTDGVYDEIPADMVLSLDQDVILRHPIQRRKLPPIPSRDRKTLSSEGKQHALETGGDRRSLPADIAPKPLQTTEAVDPQSPKQMLFNDGEKISSNKENYAKRKEEETNKIIVTGFKDTSSLEGLGFFFENKRKSGGDEIVKSDLIKDPDAFIIEFRDSSGKFCYQ